MATRSNKPLSFRRPGKHREPTELERDKFIEEGGPASPEQSAPQPASQQVNRSTNRQIDEAVHTAPHHADAARRTSAQSLKKVTFYLTPETNQALRVYCAEHGLKLSDAGEGILAEFFRTAGRME